VGKGEAGQLKLKWSNEVGKIMILKRYE